MQGEGFFSDDDYPSGFQGGSSMIPPSQQRAKDFPFADFPTVDFKSKNYLSELRRRVRNVVETAEGIDAKNLALAELMHQEMEKFLPCLDKIIGGMGSGGTADMGKADHVHLSIVLGRMGSQVNESGDVKPEYVSAHRVWLTFGRMMAYKSDKLKGQGWASYAELGKGLKDSHSLRDSLITHEGTLAATSGDSVFDMDSSVLLPGSGADGEPVPRRVGEEIRMMLRRNKRIGLAGLLAYQKDDDFAAYDYDSHGVACHDDALLSPAEAWAGARTEVSGPTVRVLELMLAHLTLWEIGTVYREEKGRLA